MSVIKDADRLVELSRRIGERASSRHQRMLGFVDLVWELGTGNGLSWVGFYLAPPLTENAGLRTSPPQELVLGPRRDKPACSPIGIHGACGKCFVEARPLLVADVRDLGTGYIACDPRDRSELVLPCRATPDGVWGVLDMDSHQVGAFTPSDAVALESALRAAGLDVDADAV